MSARNLSVVSPSVLRKREYNRIKKRESRARIRSAAAKAGDVLQSVHLSSSSGLDKENQSTTKVVATGAPGIFGEYNSVKSAACGVTGKSGSYSHHSEDSLYDFYEDGTVDYLETRVTGELPQVRESNVDGPMAPTSTFSHTNGAHVGSSMGIAGLRSHIDEDALYGFFEDEASSDGPKTSMVGVPSTTDTVRGKVFRPVAEQIDSVHDLPSKMLPVSCLRLPGVFSPSESQSTASPKTGKIIIELHSKIDVLEQEMEKMIKESNATTAQHVATIIDLQGQLEVAQSQNTKAELIWKDLEDSIKAQQETWDFRVQDLEKKKALKKQLMEPLITTKSRHDAAIIDLQEKLEDAQSQNAKADLFRKELEESIKAQQDIWNLRVQDLEKENAGLKKLFMESLITTKSQHDAVISDLRGKLEDAWSQNAKAELIWKDLEDSIKAQQETWDFRVQDLEKKKADLKKQLMEPLITTKLQHDAAIIDLQGKLEVAWSQNAKADLFRKELEESIKAHQETWDLQEQDLEKENAELKKQFMESLITTKSQHNAAIIDLQGHLEDAQSQYTKAELILKDLEDSIKAQQETWDFRVQDLEKENAELKKQFMESQHDSAIIDLQGELEDALSQNAKADLFRKELEESIKAQQDIWNLRVQGLEKENSELKNQLLVARDQGAVVSEDTFSEDTLMWKEKCELSELCRVELKECLDEALSVIVKMDRDSRREAIEKEELHAEIERLKELVLHYKCKASKMKKEVERLNLEASKSHELIVANSITSECFANKKIESPMCSSEVLNGKSSKACTQEINTKAELLKKLLASNPETVNERKSIGDVDSGILDEEEKEAQDLTAMREHDLDGRAPGDGSTALYIE